MEYTVFSLREVLEDEFLCDKLDDAIDRFNIKIDPDVSSFLKNNAINHTKINLSSTYLFLVDDEKYDYEILAYFTIVNNKVFNVRRVSEEDKKVIFIDNDTNNNQSGILIAQLGRNDKYNSHHINIDIIMNEIYEVLIKIIELGGGRFVILDCVDDHIGMYEKKGFHKIKKSDNNGLNTFIMYSKALI